MIKFCSLASGSSGNALFFGYGETRLLIDAGLSMKTIAGALASIGEDISRLSAILITHEHSDHIKGAGIVSRKYNIPIYANAATWAAMQPMIGPVEAHNRAFFETGAEFLVGGVKAAAFGIPHDAAEPVGFSLYAGGKKVTTATDIGHIHPDLLKSLEESDLLLLESNHDRGMLMVGPYPYYLKKRVDGETGHLSNEAAGEAVAYMAERGTRRFLLGHLSRENNFPELAWQTVRNALDKCGFAVSRCSADASCGSVSLQVAPRDSSGEVIYV